MPRKRPLGVAQARLLGASITLVVVVVFAAIWNWATGGGVSPDGTPSVAASVTGVEPSSSPSRPSSAVHPSSTPSTRLPTSTQPSSPSSSDSQAASPGLAVTSSDLANARSDLATMAVVPRPTSAQNKNSGYLRSAFGPSWKDVDGNGCNQREDVLWRDVDKAKPYVSRQKSQCAHDMIAGTWYDPYTGKLLTFTDLKNTTQAQAIQIDHIVALKLAWMQGANTWTADKRLQFANDIENLVAVDGPANQSKSDGDVAAWRPRKPAQCGYAVHTILVKQKYALPVYATEKSTLEDMLTTCPG